MKSLDRKRHICILGGGPVGMAMGKCLGQQGIPFDIIEKENDFGGLWSHGTAVGKVYESTHLISSRLNTQFSDFPMPADYPDYPSHTLFLRYLRDLARTYRLYDSATFGHAVTRVEPEGDGWRVSLSSGESRLYGALMIANGRLNKPRWPSYRGQFDGEVLHSAGYRGADIFRNKRVLVVGGGNSGCDIAVDAAHAAAGVAISLRRGYHFMPKYIHGMPTQDWMMQAASSFGTTREFWNHARQLFKMAGCDGTDFGLPAPDHEIDQAHPIMNSQILYHIGHGDVRPKPDIDSLQGRIVHFIDGSREEFDVIVYATGFELSFPFLDEKLLGWKGGLPDLFMFTFHRQYDNLFFAGYANAPSGLGNLANAAGNALGAYLRAWRADTPAFRHFRSLKQGPNPDLGQGRYYRSDRHLYELDAWKLLKAMNLLQARLEEGVPASAPAPAPDAGLDLRRLLQEVADRSITEEAALSVLSRILPSSPAQPAAPSPRMVEPPAVVQFPASAPQPPAMAHREGTDNADALAHVLRDVRQDLVEILKVPLDRLDLDLPLSDFGVDSILASELINRVKRRYGLTLAPTVLYEYRDLRSFAIHLATVHGDAIRRAAPAPVPTLAVDAGLPPHSAQPAAAAGGGTGAARQEDLDLATLWNRGGDPAGSGPRTRLIQVGGQVGGGVAVEIVQAGRGPHLLLIGGLGSTAGLWDEHLGSFSTGHEVIVYHPPGHGGSGYRDDRLSLDSMADDLAAVLDVVAPGRAVPIVGWSLGGIIALRMAQRHPGRVDALVLASTVADPSRIAPDGGLFDRVLSRPDARRWLPQAAGALALGPEVLAGYKRLLQTTDLRAALPRITAPTLVLAGERDTYTSPALARDIQQRIPGAAYRGFTDADHFLPLTHAQEFTRVVLGFLQNR